MKKLSKKVKVQQDTIEVYACTCYCGCTCGCTTTCGVSGAQADVPGSNQRLHTSEYNTPFAILTRTASSSIGG